MPFFAKDWRSPGEAWVKTEDGWEKLKILECRKKYDTNSLRKLTASADHEVFVVGVVNKNTSDFDRSHQPYCQVTLRCTKEIAGFNGLSDALNRLDFHNAVKDYKRFPYIAKLLNLLLSRQKITTLPGCAQKFLLSLLEEIAVQAQANGQNVHVLHSLLDDLRCIMRGDLWWGQPHGSSHLWGQHVQTVDRIDVIASSLKFSQKLKHDAKEGLNFEDLPEECVRQILFRLADHHDLVNIADAYSVAQQLSQEQQIWKRLCTYHFSPLQLEFIRNQVKKEAEKKELNRSVPPNSHRGSHPYKERSTRRSPAKENFSDMKAPKLDTEDTRVPRVQVSTAFREHINKNREILLNLQNSTTDDNVMKRNRHINFQDVRNYLDQRANLSTRPERNRNVNCKRKEIDDSDSSEEPDMKRCSDWEYLYHRLRRQFGLREEYAEILHLCRKCRCLFWKSLGHPCVLESPPKSRKEPFYVPVPPEAFLNFFSL